VAIAIAQETELARVVQLNGTVTAERDAALSVATAGLVTVLHVDAGSEVKRGDVLLELDAELAEYQLLSAEAVAIQSERALADARRRLAEARELAPKQSIAESAVKDLAAEVSEDEAALQRAQAELGFRRGVLDRHRVSAPFDGVISARSVELGEWVTPGQPILDLVSTDALRLDFQVPEDYLGKPLADGRLNFSLGADRGATYPGRVFTTVPVTDPTVRTFLLRAVPLEPVPGMLPGMSVRGDLRLGAGETGVSVPRDAVLRYPDGRVVVWVIETVDGVPTALERVVQTGFRFDGRVEIRSGLRAGDEVVVKGNESLRSGQPVDVYERAEA
jgi:RND family efflux transporter MFP subunit